MSSSRSITLTLLIAASLGAQDPAPAPTLHHVVDGYVVHDSGQLRIPVPKPWRVIWRKSTPLSEEVNSSTAAVEFGAQVLGVEGDVSVTVCVMNGCPTSDRRQAIREKRTKLAAGLAVPDTFRIGAEPEVHGEYVCADEPTKSCLITYRRIKGRTIGVMFFVPREVVEVLRPALFRMAAGTIGEWDVWPAKPEADEFETVDGFEIAFHARVPTAARRDIVRLVKSTVKKFRREHGDPLILPGEEPVLYVSSDQTANAAFVGHEGEPRTSMYDQATRRLATIPVVDQPAYRRGHLAYVLYAYLARTLYPVDPGWWVIHGEAMVAWLEEECGRPLPAVPADYHEALALVETDFRTVAQEGVDAGVDEYAAWTILFRRGSPRYRKAYTAYLEELRQTLEPETVFEKHLGEFDPDELRRDLVKLVRDGLKPVQAR